MLSLAHKASQVGYDLEAGLGDYDRAFGMVEAPRLTPKLPEEIWIRLTWPTSLGIPMRFLCRKHTSVTFYSTQFCELRKGLGKPHQAELTEYVDFGRCLNCKGPYALDSLDGQLVLKRLESQGRRTGQARAWRKRRA
ncbi:MAG: hypothetical protein ACOZHQ_14070 [Thermodesulfobacteriota bacterium]